MIRIYIDWVDEANDWPWFWLLEVKNRSLHLKGADYLHLKGADYPNGSAAHRGDEFWCRMDEIRGFRTENKFDLVIGKIDGKST